MRQIVLGAMVLLIGVAVAQSRADAIPEDQAADSANQFAADLYGQLSSASASGNLFCSPLSVYGALMMTRAGARGATATEMDAALHSPPGDAPAIAGEMLRKSTSPAGGDFVCHIASALWAQKGFKCLPAFHDVLASDFKSEFYSADFSDPPQASHDINAWVSNQTNGKIAELFSPGALPADTKLVLANAIYFYAEWEVPFSPGETAEREYHIPGQAGAQQRMAMRRRGSAEFMQGDGFSALELPYKDRETSMVILLPDAVDGLPKLEAKFSGNMLGDVISHLQNSYVEMTIPKFKFVQEFSLPKTLEQMGIRRAFNSREADFSGIDGKADLFIGDVVHKAYVAVDEKGTEAAAATGIVMMPTAIARMPVQFTADHPFMFLIRSRVTGAILFMGRVWDPVES